MRVRRLRQLFTLERRHRRLVAVDETFEYMSGRIVYIWPALDVETGEILAAYASRGRSMHNALAFLKMVLMACDSF